MSHIVVSYVKRNKKFEEEEDMERNCLGFFPAYILDGFVVFCIWAPQYTTEQFVVLFSPFWNMYLDGIRIYNLLHQIAPLYPPDHCHTYFLPPSHHTDRLATKTCHLPQQFYSPQYSTGALEHSRMLNQQSLCSDTVKWCLCNNTNKFVSIHKHYFSQIFAWQDCNL